MNTVGKNKDLRIALIVAAIGAVIYFVILPWQIDSLGMDDGLAPDLFPKMAAGAILLLGCLMTVNCLIAQDTFGSRQSTPLTWTTKVS